MLRCRAMLLLAGWVDGVADTQLSTTRFSFVLFLYKVGRMSVLDEVWIGDWPKHVIVKIVRCIRWWMRTLLKCLEINGIW